MTGKHDRYKDQYFEYDQGGNITDLNGEVLSYGSGNRLTHYGGQALTYDADGNMTYGPLAGAFENFEYDSLNRLIKAGDTEYAYDGEGTRISAGGVTYVTDPNHELSQLLMSYHEDGIVTYYVYTPGHGLVSQEIFRAGDPYGEYRAFHYDHCGNTIAMTCESAGLGDLASYYVYGEIEDRPQTTDTLFLFAGKYGVQTDANGLYYMRARYYSPEIGRFINEDPVRDGLNWYEYAGGNPISRVDPSGLFWKEIEDFFKKVGDAIVDYFSPNTHTISGEYQDGMGRGSYSITSGYREFNWRLQANPGNPARGMIGGFSKVSITNATGTIGYGDDNFTTSLKGVGDLFTGTLHAGIQYREGFGIGVDTKASVASGRATVEFNVFGWEIEVGVTGHAISTGYNFMYGYFPESESWKGGFYFGGGTSKLFGIEILFRIKP